MFTTNLIQPRIRHPWSWVIALLLSLLLVSSFASANEETAVRCNEPTTLLPNTTFRDQGEARCFEITFEEQGLAVLHVSTPSKSSTRPILRHLGDLDDLQVGFLHQNPHGLVLEVQSPGVYSFAVLPDRPATPLPEYKLQSSFVGARRQKAGANGGEEAVQDCKTDPNLDCLRMLDRQSRSYPLLALCSFGEVDDHRDIWLCATELDADQSQSGILSNWRGDDEDYFTFLLHDQRTIELDLGESEADLELHNEQGQLLHLAPGLERDGLVGTFSPGRYYLRLWSETGIEEPYEVSLRFVR